MLKKDIGGEARAGGSEDWQLTAYSADFQNAGSGSPAASVPDFPDRFYCSGREKHDIPYGRTMHDDWSEQPEWRPNAEGKITGCVVDHNTFISSAPSSTEELNTKVAADDTAGDAPVC